jgi:hypothetical protein
MHAKPPCLIAASSNHTAVSYAPHKKGSSHKATVKKALYRNKETVEI